MNKVFENEKFNPFNPYNKFNSDNDPDYNIFNENLPNLDTPYVLPQECYEIFHKFKNDSFSVLHVNMLSLKKNFEKLKLLLSKINFSFKVICLTETWCEDERFEKTSIYQLNDYTAIHQERKNKRKGGGVCCFIHNSIIYKQRIDISISDENTEALSLEIINKN